MFAGFVNALRNEGVKVSLLEYLTLLNGLKAQVALFDVEDFYFLARASLVKDERLTRPLRPRVRALFPRAAGGAWRDPADIPEEWLKQLAERFLTEEERAAIERLGGLEKLMETLRQRLMEQQGRHEGGSNGSAPPAPRRSAPMATIPKACASARPKLAPAQRGQGVGQARVPRSRRRSGARHAHAEAGAAPPAPLGARGRSQRTRSRRHHPRHGGQWRLPRPADAARAPQQGEGAAAARYRRVDGRFHRGIARSCSPPRGRSSSISRPSISTTARTRACGATTAAATTRRRRPSR